MHVVGSILTSIVVAKANTSFKGRLCILENALKTQQQIQRFSTSAWSAWSTMHDPHDHALLHLTPSHRMSIQDLQVPWDSTVSSSETFPKLRKECQVCFSYIMLTLILLKMPGSCSAGLCICSTSEFFPQGIFLVEFSKPFCTTGNISQK